jgi:hypothetical protein
VAERSELYGYLISRQGFVLFELSRPRSWRLINQPAVDIGSVRLAKLHGTTASCMPVLFHVTLRARQLYELK